jgi:uncharacterized protein
MYEPRSNSIDYLEMPSSDLALTKSFFGALFGWAFQDYGPEYVSFDDGRIAGGFFSSSETWPSAAACPLVVFYNPELEMVRADVVRLGGEITRDIFEFPGGRRFQFRAPGTGEFAVWSDH